MNNVKACIMGGAVGDALGAPVEFKSRSEILNQYGENGITDIHPAYGDDGCITDDTQLTLFTAYALSLPCDSEEQRLNNVREEYKKWYLTQKKQYNSKLHTKGLLQFQSMWGDKSAGHTCLTSFQYLIEHNAEFPIPNDRKGCGAVMRSAPIGLYFEPEDAFDFAVEAANLSHNHPDGIYSAGAFAYLISLLDNQTEPFKAVEQTLEYLKSVTGETDTYFYSKHALNFAKKDFNMPMLNILGQGWIGEQALAIAIYCALTSKDFVSGVVNAVNHDGDSDSTGAIAGNILGLIYGYEAIPTRWEHKLNTLAAIEWTCDELNKVL